MAAKGAGAFFGNALTTLPDHLLAIVVPDNDYLLWLLHHLLIGFTFLTVFGHGRRLVPGLLISMGLYLGCALTMS